MALVYRPARMQDLEVADELIVRSINDLTERHGFGPIAAGRPPRFQTFSLQDDAAGLWIAEEAGQILGFAFSWICGDLWFLAQLFVLPGHQGRGIGNELLKRTLDHAKHAGAANKALITFTFNRVSQGLYIRHGMFPRLPLYFLSAQRETLRQRLPGSGSRHMPLDLTSHLDRLAAIDTDVLGVSRAKHHRYLLQDSAMIGAAVQADGDCSGYAYISRDGSIGPLAVMRHTDCGDAFIAALGLAVETGAPQVSAFLPGTNEAALRIALECGMRVTIPMVLLSARDFGDWARYLPRNPGFM